MRRPAHRNAAVRAEGNEAEGPRQKAVGQIRASIPVTVEHGAKGAKEKVEADFVRRRFPGLVPAVATPGRDEREAPAGEDAGDGEARANRPPRSAQPARPRR
jgi:hypothetical protein